MNEIERLRAERDVALDLVKEHREVLEAMQAEIEHAVEMWRDDEATFTSIFRNPPMMFIAPVIAMILDKKVNGCLAAMTDLGAKLLAPGGSLTYEMIMRLRVKKVKP